MFENFISLNINRLVKADWNYKVDDDFLKEKLRNNIKANGQIENIIVREIKKDIYEIVNGNHRLDVFRELGIDEIMCFNLGKISEIQAKRIAVETNETKFANDTIKLSNIINEILQSFDNIIPDSLPFTEKELEYFKNLDNDIINIVSKGDENSEWAQVSDVEFKVPDKEIKLTIIFDSESERMEYVENNNLTISLNANGVLICKV